MSRFSRNTVIGIGSLILGILVFSLQDAILKSLSGSYAVTEAVFIRAVVALPILLGFTALEGGLAQLKTRNMGLLSLRGLLLLFAYTGYYLAFPALPLAMAVALFFVSPLLITLLAGLLLKERIGLKAIAASALGFAGVVVMTSPGEGLFEPAIFLSLGSAFFYALAMVLARKYGAEEPSSVMTFYQNAVYLVGAGLFASVLMAMGVMSASHPSINFLVRPWVMPSVQDFLLMAVCGVIAALGMFLLTHAYRKAEANLVAVFEYTGMIWAPLWGFLFFAETPTLRAAAGMAMIVGAGLIVLLKAQSTPQPGLAVGAFSRARIDMLLRLARNRR